MIYSNKRLNLKLLTISRLNAAFLSLILIRTPEFIKSGRTVDVNLMQVLAGRYSGRSADVNSDLDSAS